MEDYVTFEQAKCLKELGFDWKCNHYYHTQTKEFSPVDWFDYDSSIDADDLYTSNSPKGVISYRIFAPTLAQTQKWLREIKNIIVLATCSIDYEQGHEWYWFVDKDVHIGFPEQFYDTYEQALSAGIDKALEFLKEN